MFRTPMINLYTLDMARALAFYEGLGGKAGPRVLDRVAGVPLPKVGYLFG